ncbi:MAG: hypothetical protein R3C53_14760 [Pirellulaceae bacterium]
MTADWLSQRDAEVQRVDQQLRVVGTEAVKMIEPLTEAFGERIQSLTLGRPSLEDVFVAKTGHRFGNHEVPAALGGKKKRK